MSTVAAMITEIKAHGFNDLTSGEIVAIINDAVWDIDAREQWPYLDTTIDLTYNASTPTPTNFPAQFSKVLSLVNPTTGTVLQPVEYDLIRKFYPTALTEEGEPRYYYFIGPTMYVWPEPSASTTLKMAYVQWQTVLTDASAETAILMPPRHHRIIIMQALKTIYAREDDLEASAYWNQQVQERLALMTYDLFMQDFDRPKRIHSVDYEDVADYGGWDY